ncbi:MAG: dTDP-4-dehydrorhamnose 3,5-epimerase family protein [Burkholderiaceae bacterium]|nr:dTDP-4-dehydrorhamnose 3,5-epimerase family protein [Burkholderiaceae bacterium]
MSAAALETERFAFAATPLAGLLVVHMKARPDERGFFARSFCAREFAAAGLEGTVAQANLSVTRQAGTVRGLHFQHPPAAEQKLVSCLRGRVFDAAVDLREGSATFLHWFGIELSEDLPCALLIPPGFAHGFQALRPDSTLLYLVSSAYRADLEDGLHPLDPAVGIRWPLAVTLLSPRDAGRGLIETGRYRGVRLAAEPAGG